MLAFLSENNYELPIWLQRFPSRQLVRHELERDCDLLRSLMKDGNGHRYPPHFSEATVSPGNRVAVPGNRTTIESVLATIGAYIMNTPFGYTVNLYGSWSSAGWNATAIYYVR